MTDGRKQLVMFCENKKLDIAIQIMIFCIALNIFHLGQFLLPVICLLLWVNDRFRLNIKNIKVFILLCLFSLFFFVFGFKLGFYAVMGFCLPMAYYIGGRLNKSEDNIKRLIYIIALGMGLHVILNMVYDFTIYGTDLFNHTSHYDIWLQAEAMPTAVATNYMILTGCIYYLLLKEKNKVLKFGILGLYLVMMIYNITVGRRTPILMLGITLVLGVIFDFFVFGGNKKILKRSLIIFVAVIACIAFIWNTNLFGIKSALYYMPFLSKFREYGLDTGRFDIMIEGIKMMPQYLWGGQNISGVMDIQIHDLWLDIYDYAGIVPFVLMIVFTVYEIIKFVKLLINKKISSDFKVLLIGVYAACLVQAMLEPLMTGASIFLICMVMMFATTDTLSAEVDRS